MVLLNVYHTLYFGVANCAEEPVLDSDPAINKSSSVCRVGILMNLSPKVVQTASAMMLLQNRLVRWRFYRGDVVYENAETVLKRMWYHTASVP